MTSFWTWLWRGTGAAPGFMRFVDRWLGVHILVGAIMAWLLPVSLQDAATSLLLPVAGIFIGLSFAWGGNAQALLQSAEVEEVSAYAEGGYEEYVFAFQAAILVILTTLALWAVAGLGIFNQVWPIQQEGCIYRSIVGILFFFSSLTLRECWHVVLGAQSLLLMRFEIRKHKSERKQ